MIRSFCPADTNQVMNIWLRESIASHNFIEESYWQQKFFEVRDCYLKAAETFVYEESGEVVGFVSVLEKNFIGAVFVAKNFQSKGIGSELLAYISEKYQTLLVTVYVENTSAVKFYEKNHFGIVERCETKIGHDEFLMTTQRS